MAAESERMSKAWTAHRRSESREQRVRTTIDFIDSPETCSRLGQDYRVIVQITVWSADDVLSVPVGALSRQDVQWAVFAVKDGRASTTIVTIGHAMAGRRRCSPVSRKETGSSCTPAIELRRAYGFRNEKAGEPTTQNRDRLDTAVPGPCRLFWVASGTGAIGPSGRLKRCDEQAPPQDAVRRDPRPD